VNEADTEPHEPGILSAVDRWFARRRVRKARGLLAAGSFEDAARCLSGTPAWGLDDDACAILEEAQKRAVGEVERRIRELPPPRSQTGETERWWRGLRNLLLGYRFRKSERRRRRLLAELAGYQGELGNDVAAYRALAEWLSSFETSGKPSRDAGTAVEVLICMAEIDVRRAEFKTASTLCQRARDFRLLDRIEWLDAVAKLGAGDRRGARQRFERFLGSSLMPLEGRTRWTLTRAA
jgi:hypothetical protein